ncbi:MAG TPA: FHA domain-containing protein [Gammaproteobacteria bacterium]|nr:FHA domain-containing protein [Gammaproteobacteria bacterium]
MANILIYKDNKEFPVRVPDNDLYLGRGSYGFEIVGNFVGFDDPQISRRHARILRQNDRYLLQDLNSTNGTVVGDQHIHPGSFHPLKDGDQIRLGRTEIRFSEAAEEAHSVALRHHSRPAAGADTAAREETSHNSDFELVEGEVPGLEIQVVDSGDNAPNVSMMIDASRLLHHPPTARTAVTSGGEGEGEEVSESAQRELIRRLNAMTRVSISLGAIKDANVLWARIAECIFDIFEQADYLNVLLYTAADHRLKPVISRPRKLSGKKQGRNTLSISYSIVNDVIRNKHSLLLMDAGGDTRFKAQESVLALELRSVMCAPLLHDDQVLGLIQVDTRKARNSFNREDLHILTAIATQIAISVKNNQLFEDIEKLFEGFVTASVQVIESRDPVTAGHSFRVAEFTQNLVCAVDRCDSGEHSKTRFDSRQLREIRYAALLHDFGKIGVRENVLTKGDKLYPHEVELIKQRFRFAEACLERDNYRKLITLWEDATRSTDMEEVRARLARELANEKQRLRRFFEQVLEANKPTIMPDQISGLDEIAQYVFRDGENAVSLITPFEFSTLSLAKGSLNPEERLEIESHVSHTYAFLKLIPWTDDLGMVPDIAYAHHEKLDGSGYPRKLSGQDIPLPSRIMTIADIYDALTSADRPYKKSLPADKALDILDLEARAGKIDVALFEIFREARAFELSA